MRTWRTYFVVVAQTVFWFIHAFRPSWGVLPLGWHLLACLFFGAALGVIINQWESYHQDWLDRNYYTDEEMAEKEREESDPHYHRKP